MTIPQSYSLKYWNRKQWQIQDFPEGGRQPQRGGAKILFDRFSQKLHENEKKLTGGASLCPPLDPPMLSNVFVMLNM